MGEEAKDYLDRTDQAIERHFVATLRKQAYARAHPDVNIGHHFRPARCWVAIRTDPDETMWQIQEKNLEDFVGRLEDGYWEVLQTPAAELRSGERGEWWDAARSWEAPWGVGRKPR